MLITRREVPSVGTWSDCLKADPVPWLLADDTPEVRAATLRRLLGQPREDEAVSEALALAMNSGPIGSILSAQEPDGYWAKKGPGYSPKYTATVWQIIFLEQLGADGSDERVRKGCEYLLDHVVTESGGFGASFLGKASSPPPSAAIHCLNGNLIRALSVLGWLDDERVRRAAEWHARAITGEEPVRYYQSGTSGPGFCCSANEKKPCAWGAVKALRGLVCIPDSQRSPVVREALRQGAEFLLGRDPAVADYPFPSYASGPNGSWFKLGFPSGYVTDVLQLLEVLCEMGLASDSRLGHAIAWLISKQDEHGRWKNQYAYNGKTTVDFEKQGAPSKWVTLRACTVLKAVWEAENGINPQISAD